MKLLVTSNTASKIIGKGGTGIKSLRDDYGVGCHIHGSENCFPGTGCQVAVLFGDRTNVDRSLEFFVGKIIEAEGDVGPQMCIAVVLTSETVSMCIGTKGSTIAALREQSGCNFAADMNRVMGEQIVRITGQLERLSGAVGLLTPFVEKSGDSHAVAYTEYGAGDAWGKGKDKFKGQDSWGKAKGLDSWGAKGQDSWMTAQAKGSGKWKASEAPWQASAKGEGKWKAAACGGKGALAGSKAKGGGKPCVGGKVIAPPSEFVAGDADEAFEEGVAELGTESGELTSFLEQLPEEKDPNVLEYPSTVSFPIPRDAIGRVLGKAGTCAAEIRAATGVTLRIDTQSSSEAMVVIIGPLCAVQRAHCLVVARILSEY